MIDHLTVVYFHVTVNLQEGTLHHINSVGGDVYIVVSQYKNLYTDMHMYTIFLRIVVQLCIRLVVMVITKLLTYSLMLELQWTYRMR